MTERLSERWETRVEKGGRREVERRRLTRNYFGEGGRQLTGAERDQLRDMMILEPTGQQMTPVLLARQKANKTEGTPDIPKDWWVWMLAGVEGLLGHPPGEEGG